jgi:hypothetical protein
MASSGCPTPPRLVAVRLLALALLTLGAGCSRQPSAAVPVAVAPLAAPTATATAAPEPGIDLPPGPGRELLLADCLGCHDLGGIELFAGFYTRDDWRVLVQTMVTHGATLDAAGVETVAEYLTLHFGPRGGT